MLPMPDQLVLFRITIASAPARSAARAVLRGRTTLGVAVCLMALSALTAVSHARDVGSLGGGGGTPFRGSCPRDAVLTGFVLRTGSALDSISAHCRPFFNKDKTELQGGGAPLAAGPYGGFGGEYQNLFCPIGYAVRHLHVYMDKHKIVNHIRITCEALGSNKFVNVVPKFGGQAVGDVRFSCGPHEWATGIYGRAGALVDQVGLICEKLTPSPRCDAYAANAVAQGQAGKACGFTGPRWDTNKTAHADWCMALKGDQAAPAAETAARDQALKDCATKTTGPPAGCPPGQPAAEKPGSAVVTTDTDVYDSPGGNGQVLGVLRSANQKTTVTLLTKIPCPDNWCNVSGNAVPSGKGWVYHNANDPNDHQCLRPIKRLGKAC